MSPKGILAVIFGFGAGIWFSASALKKMLALQRVKQWPSVEGKITESLTYQDSTRKNATHFRVKYEFIIGDKIVGCTPRFSGDWFWNNEAQAKFVARFVAGQKVEIFYDPRDPAKNCLDREDISGIIILWIISAAGTLLASLIVWLDNIKP
jgi:Protein of unknown function (DUF3592)